MNTVVKPLSIVGAMGITFLIGVLESWRLRLRVQQLEMMIRFLQQMEEEIRYMARPIAEIMEVHSKDMPFLQFCLEEIKSGESFPDSWCRAVAKYCGGLTKEDRQYLEQFGNDFGELDQTGQVANCRLTKEQLERQRTEARNNVEKKAKLYRSLGILCGAGILLVAV